MSSSFSNFVVLNNGSVCASYFAPVIILIIFFCIITNLEM